MLEKRIEKHIDLLIERYPVLDACREAIINAYLMLEDAYKSEHKLLIAGNGGSAADSEHIAGELMKSFKIKRKVPSEFADELKSVDSVRGTALSEQLEAGLPAIPLVAHEAVSTAFINDVDGYGVFAQQLYCLGKKGDVFLGISTSGNSRNVMNAAVVARAMGIGIVALTGADGGELGIFSDVAIKVPEIETYMVQELHLPIYHCLCLMLEECFWGLEKVVSDNIYNFLGGEN